MLERLLPRPTIRDRGITEAQYQKLESPAFPGEAEETDVITIDAPMHHMEVTCDGKKTPLHCAVSIHVAQATRNECNLEIYRAGWRLHSERQLCAACSKRELEAKPKRRPRG